MQRTQENKISAKIKDLNIVLKCKGCKTIT
jgi:hypothetical protein